MFAQIRYDNLTSAVKRVLKGRRRVESDRFVALRSHYLFESQFTTPGIAGAHEKGGVEGEVGRFRRNHLVPVPAVSSLADLNMLLLAGCEADLPRRIMGRAEKVGEAWATERPLLRDLPSERFDASETAAPRVDAKSLVTIRQNRYSVPVRLAGLRVSVRIGAREITVSHAGELVARHERLQGRYGTSATLDHYLELLQRKPGGLERSLALAQQRDRGAWPDAFDELWAALTVRYGRSEAARQMVDVVLLAREHGPERVTLAVQGALAAGAHDGRAVAVLARRADTTQTGPALFDRPARNRALASAHARPVPDARPATTSCLAGRHTVTTNAKTAALEALIEAHAVELKLPTVRRRFRALADEATRAQQTPVAYLGALLEAEIAERAERRERRRLNEARFPALKRLEEFHFTDNPSVPQATIAALAEGSWIDDRESVILIGDSGTGKTHLATALAICACQAGRRVRFTTLAGLANELQEAESRRELARVVGRYARTELVVLDELGYLALPEGAAELVFQVLSERHERSSLIVTTNLPFGEWTKVFNDPRLAKAVVDRLTHRAHIIDTGTESWRFKHGLNHPKRRSARTS